ncbi:MBL fold metallo-hydrolase [Tardiphaga alba]|uniref:MBL fold metallo-hydrolase n=1 Tax=Tardiphaga alba TaxID=340268 RepID=A0ABX8A8J7_9BRAD|nr:MBL fold metallo-hydrolase [Tardiphaga alba]QUS39636.1 MBL fold metallo-hydrolase [Tardiphaga alba]
MAKQTTRATRKRQPAKAAAQTAKKRSTTASAVSVRIRKTVAAKTSAKKAKRVGSKSVGKTAGKTGQGSVSVRMYRGLLGDFFLLQHTIGDRSFRMLIDCGVLQCIGKASAKPSTAGGKERIVAGVADFMRDTGGVLDLVVATHEHFDHLSGFIHAAEAFKDLTIRKVWMAWTEDRADKVLRMDTGTKRRRR